MKRTYLIIAVACLSVLALSCKKKGCTDPIATNYDAKAKSENIRCTYEGSISFWFTAADADSIQTVNANNDSLIFHTEYAKVDSIKMDEFNLTAPECNAPKVPTYTVSFGQSDFRWVKYHIYTETGLLVKTDIVKMIANECLKIRVRK